MVTRRPIHHERLIAEGRLEASRARHQATAELLWHKLAEIDLDCLVERDFRLTSLTTVLVPEAVNAKSIAGRLLDQYGIEIAGGFGPPVGKTWRVGLSGINSHRQNVMLLVEALRELLS